jgi:hypothetical protein
VATDTLAPRSRRAVLVAGFGGLAGAIAATLGRPAPAAALNGSAVTLGSVPQSPFNGFGTNQAISSTGLFSTSQDALSVLAGGTSVSAVRAEAQVTTGTGAGVSGISQADQGVGVYGQSPGAYGTGVRGWATSFTGQTRGVYGFAKSQDGIGVHGFNDSLLGYSTGVTGEVQSPYGTAIHARAKDQPFVDSTSATAVVAESLWLHGNTTGVAAWVVSDSGSAIRGHAGALSGQTRGVLGQADSPGGTGVQGYCGDKDSLPAPLPKTGVHGYAAQDADARGVYGQSTAGRGVYGEATSGQGVRGFATTGTAVYGATSGLKSGVALRTVGRVRFDKSVGLATIAAGTKSIAVTPGIDLTSSSAVVATLQGNPGGTTTVQRVAVDATTDTFTIYLTASATTNVKVAWHVFG